ncbi:hypothetical protein FACS189465_0270 [Clostridia bacterium]|nr:hypothetical protein FACS189465_0270 [Clostridia bacterium]
MNIFNIKIDFAGTGFYYSALGTLFGKTIRAGILMQEKVTKSHSIDPKTKENKEFVKCDLEYYVDGPNSIDVGRNCLNNNIENASKILDDKIKEISVKYPKDELEIFITVVGHSRGGAAASSVFENLKRKCQSKVYKEYSDLIKISLLASEPYAGPINNMFKKHNETTIESNNKNGNDIIFYSMGTQFWCRPKQINNADIVVIFACGHDATAEALENDFFKGLEKGAYICTASPGSVNHSNKDRYVKKIEKKNLTDALRTIINYSASYGERTNVFENIIAAQLGITKEKLLEFLPGYKSIVSKTVREIEKANSIELALNQVLKMFDENGEFCGLVKKEGKFYKCLFDAKDFFDGKNNCISKDIMEKLESEANGSKYEYKKEISKALRKKINEHYEKLSSIVVNRIKAVKDLSTINFNTVENLFNTLLKVRVELGFCNIINQNGSFYKCLTSARDFIKNKIEIEKNKLSKKGKNDLIKILGLGKNGVVYEKQQKCEDKIIAELQSLIDRL